MSFFPVFTNSWVLPAAVPYLVIAGYDFWLHETDRQVPRAERLFHGVTIAGVAAFLISASFGWNVLATLAVIVLLFSATVDELKFHADLDPREKRLHFVGGAALALCIGVWLWTI